MEKVDLQKVVPPAQRTAQLFGLQAELRQPTYAKKVQHCKL
jgi:hypothetical protein